ncbi:BA75_04984T0 [Komagataella pastoris]|uniref:BA75_04984T0 n=1 Tax=Komagataella pastoris TaxID=4922 RepID=A0A1B2JJ98_PICPA|nr:BA75_04984T0 [Komagataella pastoris]
MDPFSSPSLAQAESFSPPKPNSNITFRKDPKRIDHGLTSKIEARHTHIHSHSHSHINANSQSKNNTLRRESFSEVSKSKSPFQRNLQLSSPSQRMPLTVPRHDIVNLPSGIHLGAKAKIQLTSPKTTLKEDNPFLESSPAKRKSLDTVQRLTKIPKLDKPDEETPMRPTKPNPASPATEQQSRIIDALGDGEDYPITDNPSSPLLNHSKIQSFEEEASDNSPGAFNKSAMLDELDEDRRETLVSVHVEDEGNEAEVEELEREEEELQQDTIMNELNGDEESDEYTHLEEEDFESLGEIINSIKSVHEANVIALESRLNDRVEENETLALELNSANQQSIALKSQLASLESDKINNESQITALKLEIEALNLSLAKQEKYKAAISSLILQLRDTKLKYRDAFDLVCFYQKKFETDSAHNKSVLAELNAKKSLIDQNLEKIEAQSREIEQLKEIHNDHLDDSSKEIQLWKEKVKEITEQLDTQLQHRDQLLQDAELEIKKLKATQEKLEGSLNESLNNADSLRSQLADLGNEKAQQQSQFESLEQNVESLKKELQVKSIELDSYETNNKELKESLESLETRYNSRLESQSSKINELETTQQDKMTELEESYKISVAKKEERINELEKQLVEKQTFFSTGAQKGLVSELQQKIDDLQRELNTHDEQAEQKLQQLAQDLYVQYSAKHEQKVSVLKKGYETKWSSKLNKVTEEKNTLKQEVQKLKQKLTSEREEKTRLVKLWDELVDMESTK